MLFVMAVNLFSVRAILDILGVVDYGIYNVVGGVVGMFSFLSGTLATSSQRYFSVALASKDFVKLKCQFRLNISVFLLFIFVIICIAETVGLWYVNNKMTIPADRIIVTNIIYQLSILSFAIQLITVPYNALIVAHEQMKAFAYIGIGEAFFKIILVLVLFVAPLDKLVTYGTMMLVSSLLITGCYYLYCKKHYPESNYKFYWNNGDAKDLIGFSGWHFLGTISVVVRSQGINLLINAFFSPAINAARAIAFQIDTVVNQLAGNFFVAVKPQMYKLYALKDMDEFIFLIFRSTIISVFLVSFLSIPFIINADFVLGLWLKHVPQYTVLFSQLVLFNGIIDATSNPTICAALATKRIKSFYIVTGSLYIFCLPISYFALKYGYDASSTMVISIGISLISVFARVLVLNKLLIFPLNKYLGLFAKLLLVSIVILVLSYLVKNLFCSKIISFVVSGVITVILHLSLYYFVILSKKEKAIIFSFIIKKIRK